MNIISMPPKFTRDYETEWSFIKQMSKLEDMKFDWPILVIEENPMMVGQFWILVMEAQNDN